MNRTYTIIMAILMLWCTNTFVQAASQDENIRTYTKEHPLVYEDVFDLWKFSLSSMRMVSQTVIMWN